MKKSLRFIDYTLLVKYLFILFLFLCLNNLESGVLPYSTSLLCALISIKTKPIIVCLLYFLAFVIQGSMGLLAQAGFCCVFFIAIYYLYKKFGTKTRLEYVFYLTFSQVLFLVLGDTSSYLSMEKRIVVVSITTLIGAFMIISINALENKGIRYKFSKEENVASIIFLIAVGVGLSHFISPLVYKGISITLILLSCYMLRTGLGSFFSAILGIPLAIYFNNINIIALYLALGIACESFMPINRYTSAIAIVVCEFIIEYFFSVYAIFELVDIISTSIGSFLFIFTPSSILIKFKETLSNFREKQLVRQTINRNRMFLSNKLYEISGVFNEMANAFNSFSKTQITEENAKENAIKIINNDICANCKNISQCSLKKDTLTASIKKLLDIGFAKGKLSLIDLPKEFFDNCIHPNDVIYAINKFLAEYKIVFSDNQNLQKGRNMLKNEAEGVAEILKSLALDTGTILKFHSHLERKISENLMKRGFFANEVLIFGEDKNIRVSLILLAKEFSLTELTNIIDETIGYPLILSEKMNLTQDKVYLAFSKRAKFDAVFGISKENKDGSMVSGDTYSINKIQNDKFIMALSDGMGSGEKAQNISSISLSLIESFYKAGMKSENILLTVNKLLALYTEDSFTALDVGVINLDTGNIDFIKYGSPYGFILNNNGVRIVEGNSLPLGILSELKPTICSTNIDDGDIVLLISDGISDAFGSSSEIIDYLRKIPAYNPQTLTDRILKKAIDFSNGNKKDDMTAVAVRIFKK